MTLSQVCLIATFLVVSGGLVIAEETPQTLGGSEPFVYRKLANGTELRLHVAKPVGWKSTDRRPCLVAFFAGGWSGGTPQSSLNSWAKWATQQGMVGIAPDYRTRNRFNGTPEDCVSDARAALGWVMAHAQELGIDGQKLVVQGTSAGGHLALWTAIQQVGPGRDDPGLPTVLPKAILLVSAVSDTTNGGYGGTKRFDGSSTRAQAASVPQHLTKPMPPVLAFHATGDRTVPYANAVALHQALLAQGTASQLVTFDGLGHDFYSSQFGTAGKQADEQVHAAALAFLKALNLVGR